MIGIGVIGYGYWGPNLVRNLMELANSRVVAVSDLSLERLAVVQRRYPSVIATRDYRDVLVHPQVDAVVVATPVSTHFELGLKALQAGKHLLVEKPLAATPVQAQWLLDEATRRNLVLMVDHTFVYTGAVRKIRELVNSNALGKIYYYDSVRVNLGLFQHDVDVIWDLAVHDLSIIDAVLTSRPCAVSATGISHVPGQPENIAYITLHFEDPLIAHIHVNWMSPVKIRRTLIGASQKMIVYDDLEPSEKIKIYDKGIALQSGDAESIFHMLVGYRTGDMWAPKLDSTEALHLAVQHFIRCVEGSERPITDAESGLRVVRTLEAATRSMMDRGRPVELAGRSVAA